MDATTAARPTLLSAAKNFMRKSAGQAALAIVPLAAVALAPEAKGQTIFSGPSVFAANTSGNANILETFGGSGSFFHAGSVYNSIESARTGDNGFFFTSGGSNMSAYNTLRLSYEIQNSDITGGINLPISYAFTLNKGSMADNVDWQIAVYVDGEAFSYFDSGTLSTTSATYSGSFSYSITNPVTANTGNQLQLYLITDYTTSSGDILSISMDSSTQGFTINAIPEPSTYALLFGAGVLGFAVLRRSRRCAA